MPATLDQINENRRTKVVDIQGGTFLMDVFMHRIGLHGKSIIPFILGYGCSVPAVMGAGRKGEVCDGKC
jgi:hypothetical protein